MHIRNSMLAGLGVALLFAGTVPAAPNVVVIANPSAQISTIGADEIARLFLGKTKAVAGQKLTPVDQDKTSAVCEAFYRSVVGKSPSQLRAYWSKLVFTGKGSPPQEYSTDADVVAAVASDPELVGYVAASAVDASVKVLLEVQ